MHVYHLPQRLRLSPGFTVSELQGSTNPEPASSGRYSCKVQQRPLTATSTGYRPRPALAGTSDKRPAAQLVRAAEATHGHAGKPPIVAQDRLHAATAFGAGTQAAYGLPAGPAARR